MDADRFNPQPCSRSREPAGYEAIDYVKHTHLHSTLPLGLRECSNSACPPQVVDCLCHVRRLHKGEPLAQQLHTGDNRLDQCGDADGGGLEGKRGRREEGGGGGGGGEKRGGGEEREGAREGGRD